MASSIKKKPITRNRETLTCLPCRSRKLKCDKEKPCSSCTKRNEAESCTYAKASNQRGPGDETRSSKAESRLQHLEQLVQEFVGTSSGSIPSSNPSGEAAADSDMNEGGQAYIGATHYSAMLDDIEELKQVLAEEDSEESNSPANDAVAEEADVLFGGTPRLPLATVLSTHLPPKLEVDRRLAAYFRAEAIAAPFIHVPQFMRQYEQFWTNQMSTSPLWISMLFSICNLSLSTGRGITMDRLCPDGSPASSIDKQPNFSLAAAHCLAIGRYSRPQLFAVEALGIYIQCKVITTLDPCRDIGVLFGTLIQNAYLMGYHRDPSHFKHISPFEGEMRRRAWSYCMQLDLLMSFQLGLPNNVQFSSWDTRIPSNLKDTDFSEYDTALPPPRPDTEPTKITFYTAKHMLMTIFDKILRHALSTNPANETELLDLDAELQSTYEAIPLVFHYKTITESIADPAYLVVTRRCVHLMYQKCRCVLHRKHVTSGRLASARVCYEASIGTVSAFLDLYPEFKFGGQFFEDRWLSGSIIWNDFLLGVMVLCLVLCQYRKSAIPLLSEDEQKVLLDTLRKSQGVCVEKLEESHGARRTNRLLESLLAQVEADAGGDSSMVIPRKSGREAQPSPDSGLYLPEWESTNWDMMDVQGWNDPMANVFESQEWAFLEDCLNTNFDV